MINDKKMVALMAATVLSAAAGLVRHENDRPRPYGGKMPPPNYVKVKLSKRQMRRMKGKS